jgi:hypothetical protein
MATVQLGNDQAHQWVVDKNDPNKGEFEPIDGQQVTTVNIPPNKSLAEGFVTITDPNGVWRAHSSADCPSWVESDEPLLAQLLANHYGCSIGRPADWGKNGGDKK